MSYWQILIILWTFPNNPLNSITWNLYLRQPGHIEVSPGVIMVESERVCPTINWGDCDHIAGYL